MKKTVLVLFILLTGIFFTQDKTTDFPRLKGSYSGQKPLGMTTEIFFADPTTTPDESYLLFCSSRAGGFSESDLYFTFRKQHGSWTNPQKKIPFRAERLNERVLFIKSGNSAIMSNVTAIATSKGLVVIDSHYKPDYGQRIRRMIEKAFERDDFTYLIYTHAGVDHMGGASAFPEALIIGHDNCIARINGLHDRLQTVDIREILNPRLELLRAKINIGPTDEVEGFKLNEALFYWSELCEMLVSGFEYSQPTVTFEEGLTLHLEDVTINLRYCTPGYSESDILIHIPEEKLLVVGDIFNRDRIPLLHEKSNVKKWLDLIEPFVHGKEEIRYIIGGHDEMISLGELEAQYEYLKDLWKGVVAAKKEGLTLNKVKEVYAFNKRYSHISHLNIFWISTPDNLHERNIEYIWKMAEQQKENRT